jgi:nucleotide-binding universal stress UspA family protein
MLHLSTRSSAGGHPLGGDCIIGVAYVDTEEGREALRAAYGLARRVGAKLRVIAVLRSGFGMYADIEPSVPAALGRDLEDVEGERQLQLDHELRTLLATLDGDVPVQIDTFVGDPAETLIAVSANLDLLVCGSRGHGPLRRVVLGSVSGRVTASARCPVIVLPRGVKAPLDGLTAPAPVAAAA